MSLINNSDDLRPRIPLYSPITQELSSPTRLSNSTHNTRKRKSIKRRDIESNISKNRKNRFKITQKRQKTIRDEQRNRQRYLGSNAKFSYIISHGNFLNNSKLIKIPNNIRLFQITDPRKELYLVDAYGIIKQMVTIKKENNKEKIVLNKNMEGKDVKMPPIYRSNRNPNQYYLPINIGNEFIITEPNGETTNMSLTFKDSPIEDHIFFKDLYYTLPNNKIVKNFTMIKNKTTTLEKILKNMSNKYKRICEDYGIDSEKYPLDVIQISCKVGDNYVDIDNLIRDFEKTLKINVTPIKQNCSNTLAIIDEYNKNLTPNTPYFFDWLDANYTPIYENNINEFLNKYCVDASIDPMSG
jgi:hypothetical protein